MSLAKVLTIPDHVEENNSFLAQVVKLLRNFEVIAQQKSTTQKTISSYFSVAIPKEPEWKSVETMNNDEKEDLYRRDKKWFNYNMIKIERTIAGTKIK